MKLKQFIFALVAVLLCSVSSTFAQVAKIGETEYATLQDAMTEANKAAGNYTITLLQKSDEVFTFAQKTGVNITIDGDGNTFSGKITLSAGAGNLTFTDAKIDPANTHSIYLSASTAPDVTIDGCTLQGVDMSGIIVWGNASQTSNTVTVKNSNADNLTYIVGTNQTGAENVVIENVTATNMLYLIRPLKCKSVTVKYVTCEAVIGIQTRNASSGGKLVLENVNFKSINYGGSYYTIVNDHNGTDNNEFTVELQGKNSFVKGDETYTDLSWCTTRKGYVIDVAARVGSYFCGTVADAASVAKAGDTVVLLKNTDETVELPAGVGLDKNNFTADNVTENPNKIDGSGTWGGIDWTLFKDGLLVIAPTKGEPVADKNAPTKRTYEVGEWRETVIYKSNGSASAIGGAPYDMNAVKKLIIEEGVTKIGSFTCQFPNLTGEVVIPSTVTYFGQEAFHKAPMTSLVFAAGGTESLCIANGVFKKTLIEEVSFPGDRPSIEIHHWAFGGCPNLKRAHLTANITKVWGGEHVDYFDNFNSQTNVSWTNSSMLFTGCTLLETVTFEDETIRDLFFAHDNGVNSYKNGAYNGDYIQAYIGLTAYNTLQAAINAANEGDVITMVKNVDDTFAPTEPIVVNKAVTINGNGKTFKSKADDCAFKLENDGAVVKGFANSVVVKSAAPVVMLGDGYYPTITAAASAANDGDVLTLSAGEYSEDININKNITLKGVTSEVATFAARTQSSNAVTYTGTMTIGNVTVTVENVDFVKGCIDANTSGQARQLTIKNCNFDGVDKSIGYAITQRHGQSIAIENSTAKNYKYGMLYIPQNVEAITVKDVAVEKVAAAFNIQYSAKDLFENVTISEATYGLHVGNYGERTFTLKNCTADIEHPIYIQNNGTATVTFAFEGNNDFGANNFALKGYGVLKLADGATVKAADGLTFAHTKGEDYEVAYENGTYSVVEKKDDVAKIGETGYASLAAAFAAANVEGEHTITLLADNAEVFEFAQVAGAKITVDGEGKTFTGKITLNAGAGNLTFTDMTLTPSNADAKSIVLNASTAPNVTIDGCTMKNTGTKGAIVWGQASTTNNKVVIKNSTASNLQYLVGTNQAGCEDVTVENVTATDMAYLIRPMKANKVTVKDVKYSGLTFIHVKNSRESVLALENVEVTTNGYLPIAMMTPDSGTAAAKYTITLNGENTANGAVMTKANEAAWFERQDENNPYEIINLNAEPVAKIGEQDYESLAEALAAAKAGDTITFLADITENVTVDKALTIDGAGKTYTGAMTLKADATIKNLNFDGKGYDGYAITTRGAQYLTIEGGTAKNYGYGFVQLASATALTTVKNVTVSDMSFGVKVDYSNAVVLENVDITASSAAVLNSNYGGKTITIKDSKLNILGTWDRETAIKTNYVFEGDNTVGEFKTEAAIDNFKLAAGATLTAPNDIVVTTDVEGYEVAYENGAYSVVEQKNYVAKIGTKGYETFVDAYVAAKNGDTIELLADVTVPTVTDAKINSNYDTAMFEIRKVITIDGNGHTMTADAATATNKKHTLHIHTSGVQLKNVIIDNVGKTKNVNVYCAQNVIFDNVQIINASKGSAALTINNSTVITKTAFKALGNLTAIELGIGKNITAQNLELVVEEGTVFDLGGKSVTLTNNTAKVTTAGNAVDANGNPYFAAYDTSKLYTVAQLKSKADSWLLSTFSNGLTFVGDATLDFDLKVKGTLDLNGHHITIAEGKALTAGGNLTINGNGKLGVKTIDKGRYTITIEDGAYGIDVTQYCRQGYASLPDLNGYYVVGAKPTAQVNDLGGQVIAEKDYMVYGGSKSGDMPLSFVMQFLANQTAEDMETSPYADWFADFVITFEGLEDDFVADGCYLAGYYGEFGWVKVPVDGMTVKNGERYPVMLGVGMGQKYDYICSDVKDFRCAMFLTPEVLAANPNISVKLELAVVDNSKASEGALEALVNNEKIYVVGEYTYTAENFKSPVVDKGTWGGIDWSLTYDGTLTIAPTAGEPVPDKNAPTKRTYEVGEWRETVIYKSNGSASAIGGAPYDMNAVKKLIIEEGVTMIGSFSGQFPNLTGEVVIPSTVTYIGQEAFHKAPMTSLVFAAGGTEPLCIANGAFKKTLIEEVSFPGDRASLEIHHWAFGGSSNLTKAFIPANLTKSWGGEHVDYFDNFNSQTNVTWAEYGSIFTGCTKMEEITFGSEAARNLFFENNRQSTDEDYIVAAAGLVAYNTWAEAIEAAVDGGDVFLCKNVTLKDTWTIPAGMNLTLNLNGKTLSAAWNGESTTNHIYAIHNYGTLTIKGDANGAGAIKARGMYNYGTLTLESGTIDAIDGNGGYGVYNQAGSVFVMNSGTVKTSNEDGDAPTEGTDATPMRNENGSKVVINGGTITNVSNYTYAIDNQAGAEVTINGATVTSVHSTLSNYGTMTINAGTFTCDGLDGISAHALVAWDGSVTTINGGTFNGKDNNNGFNVYAAAGADVEIKGGRFENAYSGSLYGDGNIVVSGGTFFDMIDQKWCAEGYVCKESESVEGYYDVVFDPTYGKVAMIGDTYYETLAAAITAAKANDVITFIADITEDVTLTKNVTINGAEFAYTGKMTGNAGLTITIENVAFVNGGFDKPSSQKTSTGSYTFKNCTFDGQDTYAYPIRLYGANTVTVEGCTVKDYMYSFLYIASGTTTVNVKDVTVENCPNYAVYFASGVNNGTLENLTVKNSNKGVIYANSANRSFTMKNCTMENVNIAIAGTSSNGVDYTGSITCTMQGANDFGTATLSQYAEVVLVKEATLAAVAEQNVTTDVEHYIVDYTDGIYRAIPDPMYIAELTLVDGEFTDYAPYAGLTVGEFTYQRYFSEYWSPMYLPFQVPVSVFAEAGLEVAYINGVRREDANNDGEFTDDEGFVMELIYIYGGNANGEGKTLKANYPYFVRCKTKGNYSLLDVKLTDFELPVASNKVYDCTTISEKFAISGNYNATSLTAGSNYYMVGADYDTGKAIWSNNFGTSALLPFRFYMQVTERDDYETPVVVSRSMGIAVRGEERPDGTTLIYDVEADREENDMIFDLQGRRVLETEKGGIYIKGGKKFIAQ